MKFKARIVTKKKSRLAFDTLKVRKKSPSKYGAIKTVVDGIKFDSKKEARRYVELKLLEKNGFVWDLELQKSFDLHVNGIKVCKYVCDFFYFYNDEGKVRRVVEDCKGVKTPIFNLKSKMMKAEYDIVIHLT